MIHSGTASYLAVDITLTKQDVHTLPPIFKQEFIPDKYQVKHICYYLTYNMLIILLYAYNIIRKAMRITSVVRVINYKLVF